MAHKRRLRCYMMDGYVGNSWTLDGGPYSDTGLFHPEFSSAGAVRQETFPDHGLAEGKVPLLQFGEYLPPEYAARLRHPARVVGFNQSRKIPADISRSADIISSPNYVVSSRFRDVVEQLEPGVHQFIPVQLVNHWTDEPVYRDTEWFYFNVLTWIRPDLFFDLEAMGENVKKETFNVTTVSGIKRTYNFIKIGGLNYDYNISGRAMLDKLGDKKIWRTGTYTAPNFDYYCTANFMFARAEVREAMKAAGIKGASFAERPVSDILLQ